MRVDADLLNAMAGRNPTGEYALRQRTQVDPRLPASLLERALTAFEASTGLDSARTFSEVVAAVAYAHT